MLKKIIKSLEYTIDELHWVGHNVIYAALSLLAMKELQKWGNNQAIEGITDLILSFQKTILVDRGLVLRRKKLNN